MSPCPAEPQLKRLLADELPPAESDAVQEHVNRCPRCQETLERLTADSVVRRLAPRAGPDVTPLLDLRRKPAAPAGPTPPGEPRTVGAEAAGDTEPVVDFLGPAQRPDALGRLGHYEVLQVLGRGGFGVVFRAFDDVLQRVVAIKVLAPDLAATSPARKRFLREARAAALVRHENVVQIYAVEEKPLPYLVMEYVPGETLQQRLDRTGPLEAAEVAAIGRQVADGLAAAHAAGLIHRDVKPANVLLEAGPRLRVRLTDFGLARAADDASLSQSGVVAGTPLYMSPEQARGEALDQRSDLFSLGSVLYAITSGRPPFRAENTLAVLQRVAAGTPRPIPQIIPETPAWLCRIISRLMAREPGQRYQTAQEVSDDLARGGPAPGRRDRRPLRFVLALALLAGLTGVGLWGAGLIRVRTEQGDLVLESDDPSFAFSAVQGGAVTLEDRKSNRAYRVNVVPLGRDRYQLAVLDRDADLTFHTETLTIKRGDRVALKAWFERKQAVAARPAVRSDAEARALLDWLVSKTQYPHAVKVEEAGQVRSLHGQMPTGPFRIREVWLNKPAAQDITDPDLARFAAAPEIEILSLGGQPITAAGLAHLAPLKGLERLGLGFTKVTPAEGAAVVRGFSRLEYFSSNDADWVQALAGMPSLRALDFYRPRLSRELFARLKDFPNLASVTSWHSVPNEQDLLLLEDVKTLRLLNLAAVTMDEGVLRRLAKALPECEIRSAKLVLNPGKGAEVYELTGTLPPKPPMP